MSYEKPKVRKNFLARQDRFYGSDATALENFDLDEQVVPFLKLESTWVNTDIRRSRQA